MRQNFRPYQQVVKVLKEDPGANRKVIVAQVKRAVVEADMHVHLEQCRSLIMQGQIARQFCDRQPICGHKLCRLCQITC